MLNWFRSKEAQDRERALELYGATVAQARREGFFRFTRVDDTPEGRTAMIILHLYVLIERLNTAGDRGRSIARLLAETFITDIDDSLREMGVGDLSVPKKVKRTAFAMGERCMAYRAAFAKGDAALADELSQTIPGLETRKAEAEALARYTSEAMAKLASASDVVILSGVLPYPAEPQS